MFSYSVHDRTCFDHGGTHEGVSLLHGSMYMYMQIWMTDGYLVLFVRKKNSQKGLN